MRATIEWIKTNPLSAAVICTIVATLVYFFGFLNLFMNGRVSTAAWAWQAWNPETNYEHAKIIPLLVLIFIWLSRAKLKAARLSSSRWGWFFLGVGLLLFLIAARTMQARLALCSLPLLLFGIVLYVLGKEVARILFFPIAFLFFMVPLNFLTQATFRLQLLETAIASAVCNLVGIHVNSVGTVVNSADDAFHFQVDEGCSGIHSLMAIAMLSAIYAHYTQNRLWKKVLILGAALLFALIGNAGRLVSIFAIGRFFGQDLAGGPYHNISGYLTFPFAIAAMVLFGRLLNIKLARLSHQTALHEPARYDY
jgi:exosortase